MANLNLLYCYLITHVFKLCLLSLMAHGAIKASNFNQEYLQQNILIISTLSIVLAFGPIIYLVTRPKPVYLVDYSCHLPSPQQKVTVQKIIDSFNKNREANPCMISHVDESSLEFFIRVLERSGLGDETCIPQALFSVPPRQTMVVALEETEQVIFDAIDNLLDNTKVNPRVIGIIVVNSNTFKPAPLLSAIVVNKYKLRSSIKSFNLNVWVAALVS